MWSFDEIYVLVALCAMIVTLGLDRLPVHLVAMSALVSVWMVNIVTDHQAISGFANPGLHVVACMLIVARVLAESAVVRVFCTSVIGKSSSPRVGLLRLQLAMASLSGFVNNTPLVALMLPFLRDWCRANGFSPAKFLIPLSYSSISGGLTTLMGTSTNLIIAGMIIDAEKQPLSFFEIAWLGVPLCVINILYVQAVGQWILPKNDGMFRRIRENTYMAEIQLADAFFENGMATLLPGTVAEMIGIDKDNIISITRTSALSEGSRSDPLSVGVLSPDNPPATATATATPALHSEVFKVAQTLVEDLCSDDTEFDGDCMLSDDQMTANNDRVIFPVHALEPLYPLDRILVACKQIDLPRLLQVPGIQVAPMHHSETSIDATTGFDMLEVVLARASRIVGTRIHSKSFQKTYGGRVVAVRSWGDSVTSITSIATARWRAGDTAMVLAPAGKALLWKRLPGFLVITKPDAQPTADFATLSKGAIAKQCFPVAMLLAIVAVSASGVGSLLLAAVLAIVIFLTTGHLRATSFLHALDGSVLVTIASAIGFGKALEVSGLADRLAQFLVASGVTPWQGLVVVTVASVGVTEFVTNNAAAVLLFPICIELSKSLNVSHMPFVMSLMAATSTSFASPVGYTTNLMVLGPGGYRFADFLKVGLPLDILLTAANVFLSPLIWPF